MFSISLINSLYCAAKERKETLNEKFILKVHTELGACKREEIKILMDFRCWRMHFFISQNIFWSATREEWKQREAENGSEICWNSKLLSTAIAYFITSAGTWTAVNLDYAAWGCGGLVTSPWLNVVLASTSSKANAILQSTSTIASLLWIVTCKRHSYDSLLKLQEVPGTSESLQVTEGVCCMETQLWWMFKANTANLMIYFEKSRQLHRSKGVECREKEFRVAAIGWSLLIPLI